MIQSERTLHLVHTWLPLDSVNGNMIWKCPVCGEYMETKDYWTREVAE